MSSAEVTMIINPCFFIINKLLFSTIKYVQQSMTNQLNINVLGIASNLRRIVNVNNHSDGISN